MVDVHAANHSEIIEVGKLVHCPWLTSDLSAHLDQDFAADRPNVFASLDGVAKDNLGWHRYILQEHLLDVIVQRRLALLAWEKQHDALHLGIEVRLQTLLPFVETVSSDWELTRCSALVVDRLEALPHGVNELFGHLCVVFAVKNSPGAHLWLLVHRLLDFTVDVRAV